MGTTSILHKLGGETGRLNKILNGNGVVEDGKEMQQ